MNIGTGLSYSSISSNSWCEFKRFIQYDLLIREDSGTNALVGTIAHKVLEILSKASLSNHYKESKIWDISYLWNICFNSYSKKEPYVFADIKDENLNKVCAGLIDLLSSEHTPISKKTISAEASFDISLNESRFLMPNGKYLKIRGRIDRIDKINDKTIEIIDYKSGSGANYSGGSRKKKEPSDLHKDLQPRMYHLASKTLYPWAENVLINFIYFADIGPVICPFTDDDIPDTLDMIWKEYNEISKNQDPQKTPDKWKCKICSFYKSGLCEELWKEKQQLGINFLQSKYQILNQRA